MVYRLKTCPVCNKEHRQRGPNCGQSCANTKPQPEAVKRKIKKTVEAWTQTPEGLANARLLAYNNEKRGRDNAKRAAGEYVLEPDDYALDVPFNMNEDYDDDKINW